MPSKAVEYAAKIRVAQTFKPVDFIMGGIKATVNEDGTIGISSNTTHITVDIALPLAEWINNIFVG